MTAKLKDYDKLELTISIHRLYGCVLGNIEAEKVGIKNSALLLLLEEVIRKSGTQLPSHHKKMVQQARALEAQKAARPATTKTVEALKQTVNVE